MMLHSFRHLVILWALISVPGPNAAEQKTGKKMETQTLELPFQLKAQDLLKVEFQCEYFPDPSKSWTEAIHISGVAGVTLLLAKPGVPKPDILHAKQDGPALIALLKYFEDNGFLEEEVEVDPTKNDPITYLSLFIPGQSNRVAIAGKESELLNQLFGAVKMTAGLSVPEALGKTFLQHL